MDNSLSQAPRQRTHRGLNKKTGVSTVVTVNDLSGCQSGKSLFDELEFRKRLSGGKGKHL